MTAIENPKIRQRSRAAGKVAAPAMMFAALAVLLAAGFERVGLLAAAERWLAGVYERLGFGGLTVLGGPLVWLVLGIAALALAWAVLDSPQGWRRMVLGVSALVITAGWSPVLATIGWQIPVMPLLLGVGWAWFCAFIYAQQHRMPCDGAAGGAAGGKPTH